MNLKETCEQILELDKKATKGPWGWEQNDLSDFGRLFSYESDGNTERAPTKEDYANNHVFCEEIIKTDSRAYPPSDDDAELIAIYRNHAPKLAKAALIAYEALEKISDVEPSETGWAVSDDALAEIDKLFGEK